MKKIHFFLAFTALLAANIFVYSCQKESPVPVLPSASSGSTAVTERSVDCPFVQIGNGVGLSICGITGVVTPTCNLCGLSAFGGKVNTNPQNFGVWNTKFSVTNTTASSITFTVDTGCGPISFTVLPGATLYIGLGPDPTTGCCIATTATC